MKIISTDPCPGCGGVMVKVDPEKTILETHKWICPDCKITREILLAQSGSESEIAVHVMPMNDGDATK